MDKLKVEKTSCAINLDVVMNDTVGNLNFSLQWQVNGVLRVFVDELKYYVKAQACNSDAF